jgi:hypothetical protein
MNTAVAKPAENRRTKVRKVLGKRLIAWEILLKFRSGAQEGDRMNLPTSLFRAGAIDYSAIDTPNVLILENRKLG